ncbi:hypothetical protein Bca4012_047284 [Brassica carinata]
MIASVSDLVSDLVSLKIAHAMMGYVVETVVGFFDRWFRWTAGCFPAKIGEGAFGVAPPYGGHPTFDSRRWWLIQHRLSPTLVSDALTVFSGVWAASFDPTLNRGFCFYVVLLSSMAGFVSADEISNRSIG